MHVDELHFSQDDIAEQFRNGRALEATLYQLNTWQMNPRPTDWLVLEVIEMKDRDGCLFLWSNDNRRLGNEAWQRLQARTTSGRVSVITTTLTTRVSMWRTSVMEVGTSHSHPVQTFGLAYVS